MAEVLKAPAPIHVETSRPSIFLAGSIEWGRAEHWQDRVVRELADHDVTLFNPRRDDWDKSWKDSLDDANFRQQVTWELDAQEVADLILMHFDPATKAPVTLLELGLAARTGKLVISCPPGFWRRGNVEAVSSRYGIPFYADLAPALDHMKRRLADAFTRAS